MIVEDITKPYDWMGLRLRRYLVSEGGFSAVFHLTQLEMTIEPLVRKRAIAAKREVRRLQSLGTHWLDPEAHSFPRQA